MKFCRFALRNDASSVSYGIVEDDIVHEITAAPWTSWNRGHRSWGLADIRFLAPVEPRKIVCVGRNFAAHAAELGNEVPKEPLIFLKPSSSIIGPDEPIVLPRYSQRVEHEGELALIVGRRCSHLADTEDALSYLTGYSCLNDVTARDLQKSDGQFTRAKGFDTFCPIGPWIESELDPSNLTLETSVNRERRQFSSTSLMLHSPAALVRWISRMMTLDPGDVIATGTPAGVGPLLDGDLVEVSIERIGVLRNPVHAPSA
jgi:2-keto-4-pentenoate hydratase/2-oxohepta-3-ene-1,7-dioic acid hydratase in catechol pathway